MSRDVYSSVSADITSMAGPASSRSWIGGSGESGRSSKSGFCFSFSTRFDFGISVTGGSMWIGVRTSSFSRTSSTISSRFTTATSPTLRSRFSWARRAAASHSHSMP